ncbi:hypothetical protein MKW92_018086, partial [Papaver armeniacum]
MLVEAKEVSIISITNSAVQADSRFNNVSVTGFFQIQKDRLRGIQFSHHRKCRFKFKNQFPPYRLSINLSQLSIFHPDIHSLSISYMPSIQQQNYGIDVNSYNQSSLTLKFYKLHHSTVDNYNSNNFRKMAEIPNETVTDLAEKFQSATLELGNASEAIVHHYESEGEDSEENQWDNCLIGKVIIEGKMSDKTVERQIQFVWNFLQADEVK